MGTVAVGIMCKTPSPGQSKTRLSPPLHPDECAALSACFILDLSRTIDTLAESGDVTGYAIYTPLGSEEALLPLLPARFKLLPQVEGDLGARVIGAFNALLEAGHRGAILVNSDSPTLPQSILRAAVKAVLFGDNVVLGPALDGGYTLVGLSRPHPRLFEDIPWSTAAVYRVTVDRAREIDLAVVDVPAWYDVDDEASFRLLEEEFKGRKPAFAGIAGAEARATREFLTSRQAMPALSSL